MDDLQSKTDAELRQIMRSSLSNQYAPSSIYHRAKQELEFRMEKSNPNLSQMAKAILNSMSRSTLGTDITGKITTIDILENQFGEKHKAGIKDALEQLEEVDFVEKVEGSHFAYHLTPFGDNYIGTSNTSNVVNYNNITNSNISHESTSVQQSINIDELPQDIRENLQALNEAASKKDSNGMKRAFSYIADKAVDVAIAVTLGQLGLK